MAQLGQVDWRSQALGSSDGVNNFPVQAALDRQLYREVRDAGVFGDMAIEKALDTQTNGMFDAETDVAGSGAVWTQTLTEGDEKRFSLVRNITGAASYGDVNPSEGDYQGYLFQNVYLNEVDSVKIPIPGRMSAQRIKQLIPDLKSPVRQALVNWHAEERDWDLHTALFEGQSYPLHLDPSVYPGALGKDLGLGVGVGAPNENFFTGVLGDVPVTTPSQGPRSTQYRTAVLAALKNLYTDGSKYFTRRSIRKIRELATRYKIRPIEGKAWKYELLVDPALLASITDVDGSLENRYALAQQGNGLAGQKSLDITGPMVIDEVRLIPSRTFEKFRPLCSSSGLNQSTPVLQYGDGTLDRRNKLFVGSNYTIGFAVLLGNGGLLELNNSAVQITEIEGDDKKGWEAYAWTMRGARRGFWQRRDGEAMTATDGWLNQNSMQFAFNIATSGAIV